MANKKDRSFGIVLADTKFGIVDENGIVISQENLGGGIKASMGFGRDKDGDETIHAFSGLDSQSFSITIGNEEGQFDSLMKVFAPAEYAVEFRDKEGMTQARALIATKDDAERLMHGEEVVVTWQKFTDGEWIFVERRPLKIEFPPALSE